MDQVWALSPQGAGAAAALTDAVLGSVQVSGEGLASTGPVLTVHFTDTTQLCIPPAADAAIHELATDHWILAAHSEGPNTRVLVRLPELTAWHESLDPLMWVIDLLL